MKRATKARRLAERCEDEAMEVEHLYQVLKTNIVPDEHTESSTHKVNAMHALAMARDQIELAAKLLEQIV